MLINIYARSQGKTLIANHHPYVTLLCIHSISELLANDSLRRYRLRQPLLLLHVGCVN